MRGAPSAGRTTAAIPHAPPPTAAGARKTCGSSFLPGRRGPLRRARPASPPPAPRAAPRPAATAVPARPHAAPLRGGSPATGAGLRPGRLGRPLSVGPPRRPSAGTGPLRRPARSHPTTTSTLPLPPLPAPPLPGCVSAGQRRQRQPGTPGIQEEEEEGPAAPTSRHLHRYRSSSSGYHRLGRGSAVLQLRPDRTLPGGVPQPTDVLPLQGYRAPRDSLFGPPGVGGAHDVRT